MSIYYNWKKLTSLFVNGCQLHGIAFPHPPLSAYSIQTHAPARICVWGMRTKVSIYVWGNFPSPTNMAWLITLIFIRYQLTQIFWLTKYLHSIFQYTPILSSVLPNTSDNTQWLKSSGDNIDTAFLNSFCLLPTFIEKKTCYRK